MTDGIASTQRKLQQLLASQFLFMAAYVTIRVSITLYLVSNGFTENAAYSIATTAISWFALCAISWGYFAKYLPTSDNLLGFASTLQIISYLLLAQSSASAIFFGLSCYVVAGSLFFLNITLLINAIFKDNSLRLKANQKFQLVMNIGALIGELAVAFIPSHHYHDLYLACLLPLACLAYWYRLPFSVILSKKFITLLISALSLIILTLFFIHHAFSTRILVSTIFLACIFYIFYLYIKEKHYGYLIYLALVIFGNTVYWLCNTIYTTQFTLFLKLDVLGRIMNMNINPLAVIAVDPLSNILLGGLILLIYTYFKLNDKLMVFIAQLFITLSFLLLIFGISSTHTLLKVSIIWPILARVSFAIGEFLTSTILRSQIVSLITNTKHHAFFMGFLRLSQAFGAISAFYLLNHIHKITTTNRLIADLHLYKTAFWISLMGCCIIGISVMLWRHYERKNNTSPSVEGH